ncbi:hypothetical protein CK203_011470 [Vitis vinifera]|uniref:Retrotransposon gag domain-containing protein n=1 Tax=Vitis vinifera TaxID=29760 RepID=A0A438JYD2_VITVI|nr:hypothetical protein CK203_011470 [Vitis vinifera]
MSGFNMEETSEQTRGREMEHTARGRGRKDKSRDALANMEARLAKVELAKADTREGVDLIEQGMEKGLEDLREHIQNLREGCGVKDGHLGYAHGDPRPRDSLRAGHLQDCGLALTDEATKVHIATLYLTDNATLWWRRRCGLPSKEEYEASQAYRLDPGVCQGVLYAYA